jgi:RNA polymerase sigma-B factor
MQAVTESLELFERKSDCERVPAAVDPLLDLVEQHLPLVRSLARRYLSSGEPLEDLVQVASLGLVAAARRFDRSRGIPFAAYAAPTIDGELRRYLRDRAGTIRVPRRERELAADLRRAVQALSQVRGREPSLSEAAAAVGVSSVVAAAALRSTVSPLPLDLLEPTASSAAEEEIEACERRQFVRDLLAVLTPREREIVLLRFAEDLSQLEIGRRVHLSQSQASRLLAAALEKLRRAA